MPIPPSFQRDGLIDNTPKRKYRRLMIGSEGESESGKTEFIASAPGPGVIVCLDRGHEAMLDNANPPPTRRDDFVFRTVNYPVQQSALADKPHWAAAWAEFRGFVYKAADNADCLTIGIDTDSASWELQQLVDFGRTRSIMPLETVDIKAARRAFITRLFDSGKNVIATNMLKDEWEDVIDPETGKPALDEKGKKKQQQSGARKRQGFPDQNYLWQVQIRHLSKRTVERVGGKTITSKNGPVTIGGKEVKRVSYGIEILKCKANGAVVGDQLWDEHCNFLSLALHIYPNSTPAEWGYK